MRNQTIKERAIDIASERFDRGQTPREILEAVDWAFRERHLRIRLLAIRTASWFLLSEAMK